MDDEPIVVLLVADHACAIGAATVIASALKYGSGGFIVNIIDAGLSGSDREGFGRVVAKFGDRAKLVFHSFDNSVFVKANTFYGNYSTYARLLAEQMLDSDWCFYLDADLLVTKDLRLILREIDLSGNNLVWGVAGKEIVDKTPLLVDASPKYYINAGVAVYNLREWRRIGLLSKVKKLLSSNVQLQYHDQTIINYVSIGRLGLLDENWNFWVTYDDEERNIAAGDGRIYHFVGPRKPWSRPVFSGAERMWVAFYRECVAREFPLPRKDALKRIMYKVMELPYALMVIVKAWISRSCRSRSSVRFYKSTIRGYWHWYVKGERK